MKRHFYTDPLAAAWQAKHFGMTMYTGHFPDDFDSYGSANWHHCVDDWKFRQENLKQPAPVFYIHPDSLHLLEPQPGDLLTGRNRRVFMFYDNRINPMSAVVAERNGITFMWPESEEA